MNFNINMITLAIAALLANPASLALADDTTTTRKLRGNRNLSDNTCNSYDGTGSRSFGRYYVRKGDDDEAPSPPCDCVGDSMYPQRIVFEYSSGWGYLCTFGDDPATPTTSDPLPTCNAYSVETNGTSANFGIYHNQDGTPPCGCDDTAYPELVEVRYFQDEDNNIQMAQNGDNYGYFCISGQCPVDTTIGMNSNECHPDVFGGCECTGDTVKTAVYPGCNKCIKEDEPTPSPTPSPTTPQPTPSPTIPQSTPSPTPQVTSSSNLPDCYTYDVERDGWHATWNAAHSTTGGAAPCDCSGTPDYPVVTAIEYANDGNSNTIQQGGGNFAYVCTSGQCPTTSDTCLPESFGSCGCPSGEVKVNKYTSSWPCYYCAEP